MFHGIFVSTLAAKKLKLTKDIIISLRNTKKCQDKVASLEKEVEDTRAKMEGLKVGP